MPLNSGSAGRLASRYEAARKSKPGKPRPNTDPKAKNTRAGAGLKPGPRGMR